jgi:hypothetical protein
MSSSNDYGLKLYNLDQKAQDLVLDFREQADVLNESHKMRVTASYGLERFWGEHIRLLGKGNATDVAKGKYWRRTWETLADILDEAGLELPDSKVLSKSQLDQFEITTEEIKETSKQFWNEMDLEKQRIALSVLIQLCDSLVWWTQRYKKKSSSHRNDQQAEDVSV